MKRIVFGALAMGAALIANVPTANACGIFVPSIKDQDAKVPSLSIEQALLIYDAKKEREHFIREIRVDGGDRDFGFVVPVPSKPEVVKMGKGIFAKLEDKAPFERPRNPKDPPGGGGMIRNAMGGAEPAVTVVETKKVGSFTATVLLANQGDALAGWLKANGFAAPDSAKGWIGHYVRLGFYFVAFRFDGKKGADAGTLVSETVRLSFDTPRLYYPFLEPNDADAPVPTATRLLRAWTVTAKPVHGVASFTPKWANRVGFLQPWLTGAHYDGTEGRAAMTPELAALLPTGDLTVQSWRYTKAARRGLGDIVFAPADEVALDDAATEKLKKLLPVLDPSLNDGETPVTVGP